MAKIVVGIGTSHGPMLSTPPDQWGQRVAADRRNPEHWFKGKAYNFEQLVAMRQGEHLEKQLTQQIWNDRHAACQRAIGKLAAVFAEAKPDVAVIVGNDQMEMFKEALIPAMSVYRGETIPNEFPTEEEIAKMPPGIPIAIPGHIPLQGATYNGLPELATHIIEQAIDDRFDITSLKSLPAGVHHIPHAFGFVFRQIMSDKPVPTVPVVLNTFYPPNQPTVERCYAFGKSLLRAIESWKSDARVALIASGGLTHFVIDEEVDNAVLDALRARKIEGVAKLGEAIFQAGTSEVKNWVPVAGAMADLGYEPNVVDYVPCYRSEAGTGNAMAFVYWRP
jgi:Catalytic LigB subunit of aromatic ring-opening dioxygenase